MNFQQPQPSSGHEFFIDLKNTCFEYNHENIVYAINHTKEWLTSV
jgi:hypothetical protein